MRRKKDLRAMEEFLIDYIRLHSRKRIFSIDEGIFEKHPLDEERYERIKALIEKRADYDAIQAKYGIETEKLSPEEFAEKKQISVSRAKAEFGDVANRTKKDIAVQIYALAVPVDVLRKYIFEAQFELHNMQLAYDSLTDKSTVCSHHVGICDGPTLGQDLFNKGFDTLEEVRDAEGSEVLRKNGFNVLNRRSAAVSKALDKYGIENTYWRGAMQLVSTDPVIYAIEDYDVVKVHFNVKGLKVNEQKIKVALGSFIVGGYCTEYETALDGGSVTVHFNPAVHTADHRHHVIETLAETIRGFTSYKEEKEEY